MLFGQSFRSSWVFSVSCRNHTWKWGCCLGVYPASSQQWADKIEQATHPLWDDSKLVLSAKKRPDIHPRQTIGKFVCLLTGSEACPVLTAACYESLYVNIAVISLASTYTFPAFTPFSDPLRISALNTQHALFTRLWFSVACHSDFVMRLRWFVQTNLSVPEQPLTLRTVGITDRFKSQAPTGLNQMMIVTQNHFVA